MLVAAFKHLGKGVSRTKFHLLTPETLAWGALYETLMERAILKPTTPFLDVLSSMKSFGVDG